MKRTLPCLLAVWVCSLSPAALAAGYGIYDARTLALGGAGVALGNSRVGFYYNPALMAFNTQSKNKANSSYFYLPTLQAEVAQGALDAEKIQRDELDQALNRAINVFNNTDFSLAGAAQGLAATEAVNRAIDKLSGRHFDVDAYAGLAVAIPSAGEGGGLFIGSRVMGSGYADVPAEDRALLNKYTNFLRYVTTNNTLLGAPTEGIFDADAGGLIDPTLNNSINSSAIIRGVALSEIGIAASGKLQLPRAELALGLTPKVVQANVLDAEQRVVSNGLASEWKNQSHHYMNLDAGAALQLSEHYRVGFALKDALTKHFASLRGHTVTLQARYRLGVAYQKHNLSLGIESDLRPAPSFVGEPGRQDLALGAEYRLKPFLELRGGYRRDVNGKQGDALSFGLGFNYWGCTTDIAYAEGKEARSIGLQWGKRF